MSAHSCHAVRCTVNAPPRLLMCARHWRMVPKGLQAQLWAAYRPGQERRMDPTPDYLRAAAACVEAVAKAEGHPGDEIAHEVGMYESWAEQIEPGRPSGGE